jgi:hypothetical protein
LREGRPNADVGTIFLEIVKPGWLSLSGGMVIFQFEASGLELEVKKEKNVIPITITKPEP